MRAFYVINSKSLNHCILKPGNRSERVLSELVMLSYSKNYHKTSASVLWFSVFKCNLYTDKILDDIWIKSARSMCVFVCVIDDMHIKLSMVWFVCVFIANSGLRFSTRKWQSQIEQEWERDHVQYAQHNPVETVVM